MSDAKTPKQVRSETLIEAASFVDEMASEYGISSTDPTEYFKIIARRLRTKAKQ